MKLPHSALVAVLSLYTSSASWAQTTPTVPGEGMSTNTAIPSLMFATLGGVLLVAIVSFVMFLRKRSNRDAASRALLGKDGG